ncbi:hypothetical protein LCGC14_2454640 [marine sediment metagenome]|uniref:Uncharacterized protein n=1 Tax=marine sediment metagenome TaxID=412755 RepID=A0A0F9BFJ6_9ZZZZ
MSGLSVHDDMLYYVALDLVQKQTGSDGLALRIYHALKEAEQAAYTKALHDLLPPDGAEPRSFPVYQHCHTCGTYYAQPGVSSGARCPECRIKVVEQAVEAKWKEAIGATDLQGSSPDNFIRWLRKDVAEQAKAEERERCCKAMCEYCREVNANFFTGIDGKLFHHTRSGDDICRAEAIRRGGGDDT